MLKDVRAALVSAAALVAAACSSGEEPAAASPPATGSPASSISTATSTSPAATRSVRGNLVKSVGAPAGLGGSTGGSALEWRVTSVTVDEPCTQPYATPAELGHFVSLQIEATSSPSFDPRKFPGGFKPVNNWRIVDADGFTVEKPGTLAAAMCHDSNLPETVAPGSKYRFRVTLDSPSTAGVAVFTLLGSTDGWEWQFPA